MIARRPTAFVLLLALAGGLSACGSSNGAAPVTVTVTAPASSATSPATAVSATTSVLASSTSATGMDPAATGMPGPTKHYATPDAMLAAIKSIQLHNCGKAIVNVAGALSIACNTPTSETVYVATCETPGICMAEQRLATSAGMTPHMGEGWVVNAQRPSTADTLFADLK